MNSFTYSDFEIYDSHAHVFPEKISEKAAKNIGAFYGIPMAASGSSSRLLESGEKIGVSKYLVCSTATTSEQVESINDFIKTECDLHKKFIGFGTLHPDFEDIAKETDRIISLGLKGVKLHPDFQKFNIDDKKAYAIYESIEGRLPVLIHMGDNRYDYSKPFRLVNIMKDFPKLQVIAAHLGGYQSWDEASECLGKYDNVRFDTCSSLDFISVDRARELINQYGVEKCFFGTDFPMWDHVEEVERFMKLGFSYDEYKKMFSENIKDFLNIK